MKMFGFKRTFIAVIAVAGLVLPVMVVAADNSPAATAPPQLSYGVPQILKLAQAKVSDDVIIAYIHSSVNSYGLDADQIVYLKQSGISENVIVAMLNQPKPAPVAPAAPQPASSYSAPAPAAETQPATAYVQAAPSPTVYVMPNSQPYYTTTSYYTYSTYRPFFYASYYPYCYHSYYPRYYCARPYSTSFAVGIGGRFHGVAVASGFHGGATFHGGGIHAGGTRGFHR